MQQRKIAGFKLCCFVAILELAIGQIRDEKGDWPNETGRNENLARTQRVQ